MSLTGVVKSYGHKKGYGFIQSDQVEGDVFMGHKNMPPDLKEAVAVSIIDLQGKQVMFDLAHKDGKQSASNVTLIAQNGASIVGTVKSYNDKKGYGFLTTASIDGDVFFSRREIASGAPVPGAVAALTVLIQPDGKHQGKALNIASGPPSDMSMGSPMVSHMGGMGGGMRGMGGMGGMAPMGGMGQMGMHPMHMGMEQGMMYDQYGKGMGKAMMPMSSMGKGAPMGKGAAAPPPENQGMTGSVKKFDAEKGWGFITSSSLQNTDIYFKAQPGETYEPGMWLSFQLHWTRDGKPQARNIVLPLEDGQTYTGTIRSFVAKKGYGFIQVPDQPTDVYLRQEAISNPYADAELAGCHVQFTAKIMPDGKAQAQSCQLLDSAPSDYTPPVMDRGVKRPASNGFAQAQMAYPTQAPMPPTKRFKGGGPAGGGSATGSQVRGVVKSYNPEKGWGFIQSPSVEQDLFFQRRDLPPPAANRGDLEGQACGCTLTRTPDGKPRAQNVQLWG